MSTIKVFAFAISFACILNGPPFKGQAYASQEGGLPQQERPEMFDGWDITIAMPWLKSGKLFANKCYFRGADFNVQIYMTEEGERFYIGCMDSVNTMLARESKNVAALKFLEDEMTGLVCFLSATEGYSGIITEGYVKLAGAKSREVLRPYIIDEEYPTISNKKNLTVEGSKWKIFFNVKTRYGAIEAWSASGTVEPLRITTFCINILKPEETLRANLRPVTIGGLPYLPPEDMSDGRDITYTLPWVKSGKVFQQNCRIARVYYDIAAYKTPEGDYFFLPGCMNAMNIMLAREMNSDMKKDEAVQFLEKSMVAFIQKMLSTPFASSAIINEDYIKTTSINDQKILRPFISGKNNLAVKDNTWTINFNVRTKYGAIESWSISGTVEPLRITSYCKNILKLGRTAKAK